MPCRSPRWLLALCACLGLFVGCTPPAPRGAAPPATVGAATAAPATPATPAAAAPPRSTTVRSASTFTSGDVGLYIGLERGYFQQEGIDLELIRFSNASEVIPSLATGQIEMASAGSNPATWNAIARGIPLKIVLDKGTFRPGWGDQALAIRKAVNEARPVHSLADMRGMTIALTPPGKATASGCVLAAGLQRVGMTLDDVSLSAINFPDMLAALSNGAIDGAMLNEPFLARALAQGTAVRAVDVDQMYPNFTISAFVFGPKLYDDTPAAKGFVRAYIRAIRDYLGARDGTASGFTWDDVDAILAKYTGIEPAVVHEMSPPGFNADALPNRDALLYCYQFFRGEGLIPEPVSEQALQAVWGTSLVEEVLSEMGRAPTR